MPKIYWMSGYNIREGKHKAYKTFLNSRAFKKLCSEVESDTGMKHVETYFVIIPSPQEEGDYSAYSIWELPNHAAMDRMRKSVGMEKFSEALYDFVEPRPAKSVLLRKASDTKIMYEPPKK